MDVLGLVHLYPPHGNAGAEWALHTLLAALQQAGHTVRVAVAESEHSPYTIDGVAVRPCRNRGDLLAAVNPTGPPDVIVTHLRSTPQATVLGELYRIPVVHVLHNDHLNERTWLTRRPSLVVYNSQWVQSSCHRWWRDAHDEDPPDALVVRPPVIAADYATTPGDAVTLINLCDNKGAGTFWELARRMPDVRFLAVEGAYGQQVVHELPNVTVQEHVSGHDMRNRVYGRTRILLMPSFYESWGRAGVEAMCSGIPVIAHPTPGLLESLGPAGIFCDRDDLDGWERRIRHLLQPAAWARASRTARERADQLQPDADLRRWVQAVERLGAA